MPYPLQSPYRWHRIEHHQANEAVIHDVYDHAFFLSNDRPCFRANGQQVHWGIDVRRALGRGDLLPQVAILLLHELRNVRATQVAGRGYGSFLLVGGLLAVGPELRGCLVRKVRKGYGFREIIEGAVEGANGSVMMVDDLISSGRTLQKTANQLREGGLTPIGALTLFEFGWKSGRKRLEGEGLLVRALATLHRPAPTVVWQPSSRHPRTGLHWQDK